LHTDDQLVARNVFEDSRGDILELDANLRLLLVESCKSQPCSKILNRVLPTFTGL
jgi:hypothetical protein